MVALIVRVVILRGFGLELDLSRGGFCIGPSGAGSAGDCRVAGPGPATHGAGS